MRVTIKVTGDNGLKTVDTPALIDSGAGGEFVDEQFIFEIMIYSC